MYRWAAGESRGRQSQHKLNRMLQEYQVLPFSVFWPFYFMACSHLGEITLYRARHSHVHWWPQRRAPHSPLHPQTRSPPSWAWVAPLPIPHGRTS